MTLNKQYQEATEWLFQQFPQYQLIGAKAFKPTLENIRQLLDWVGNPQEELTFIHVAGSNGKGSTCSMLASILTESVYSVGLYTSPHIEDYTERIRINGLPISKEAVVDFVHRIQAHTFAIEPSFFEITFALSLDYFKRQQCDICVIETGLGGRLDATNIISPLLSIITNISLEHTQFLGDTLELIATEKAGIIKQHTPVVLGPMSEQLLDQFTEIATTRNAPTVYTDLSISLPEHFPLLGNYQHDNYRLVITALNTLQSSFPLKPAAIERGLANLAQNSGLRARLQVVGHDPLTIIDVSHNPDGIEKTMASLQQYRRGNLHIVYGTSSDKDIESIISLFPTDARFYFTTFSNPRSATVEQLKTAAEALQLTNVDFFSNLSDARVHAQNTAKQEDTILIIGSFFLISDFF